MPIQTPCTCGQSLTEGCSRDIKECKQLFLTEMDNCYNQIEDYMSDARTTPPSFDDLVGLIEKNFKDYLKQSQAFNDKEIEEGWVRYKTLNHLYQDGMPHLRKESVEEQWDSFWKPIVTNEDGTINIEQVKKELYDFSFVMEQVPKVYCHITGSRMSKVMYHADTVIAVADDYFQEQLEEAVKDEVGEQSDAAWVKASDRLPGYETPVKWRDGKDHSHVTDGKIPLIDMAKPFLVGWEWLDEGTAATREEDDKEVIDFIRDIATNWDCDEDGHKYNTGCRKCSASELLYDLNKQQKEKR